ncbi:MAG: hypothetical protein RI953_173 [Pseudomonadota bacterium]|jgi:hypothetical protein
MAICLRKKIGENKRTWAAVFAVSGLVVSLFPQRAHAGARYVDISLTGSYQSDIQKYQTSTRRSLGLEIGLPLTHFLDLSLSHTQILDRDVYNELYRETKKAQGVTVPEGDIEQKTQIVDTSVNAAVGYSFGYVKPTLFGGALWRRSCLEDTFQDYGCSDQDVTWNAGIGLSAYITMSTRFRVSYRRSPSASQESSKKNYDELTSIGLTWSL